MAEEATATGTGTETLEQLQARHRKEAKDLQGRITSKKKNATKKTRKFVNDECAELERALKERQEGEVRALLGEPEEPSAREEEEKDEQHDQKQEVDGDGELVAGVEGVRIQEPAQQQQQNGGGQGGKKRNRQKDRLARRAAEAEAAAIAAESEAANMTDYRSIERSSMLKQFETHGLEEKEIAPDGHCLFSAVADQLAVYGVSLDVPEYAGDTSTANGIPGYRQVRQVAAGYMTSHADDYAPFMEEPLESYVAKIRDTAEWGGQLELSALANAYNMEIKVVQTDGRTEIIRPNGIEEGGNEDLKTVWLAYYKHGYGLGEHYNSLRRRGGEGK